MGLDWNPANKPRPGHEDEYARLFRELADSDTADLEEKERRFKEISISAFETLQAPRVGFDENADKWARERFERQQVETPIEQWLDRLRGFYVVSLVPTCDGIPRYSNGSPGGYVEPFSFRAQFLTDCTAIIGDDYLQRAYDHQLPEELLVYGRDLFAKAEAFAAKHGRDLDALDIEDFESVDAQLDAVVCASRWCVFWAERGHPLEAYW